MWKIQRKVRAGTRMKTKESTIIKVASLSRLKPANCGDKPLGRGTLKLHHGSDVFRVLNSPHIWVDLEAPIVVR